MIAPRRGFTLLEVLLGVVLLLGLSAGMTAYLWGLLGRRDRLVEALSQQVGVAALFTQLETDLATTFSIDGAGKPGVRGAAGELVVLSRGVGLVGGDSLADLQRTELRFSAGEMCIKARRGSGEFETISEGVERLRLRYFDGSEWKSSFDSAAVGGLPVAVEVAVWFAGDGEPVAVTPPPEATASEELDGSADMESDAGPEPVGRAPDRVRVIVVPDGPVAGWKERA